MTEHIRFIANDSPVYRGVYRGVAPTTNRGTTTDYHGDPIATTGKVTGERSVAVHLTPTEVNVIRLALYSAHFATPKYLAVQEALLLTFNKYHDVQTSAT